MLISIRTRNQGIVNIIIIFSTPEKVVTYRVDRQCNGGVKKHRNKWDRENELGLYLAHSHQHALF